MGKALNSGVSGSNSYSELLSHGLPPVLVTEYNKNLKLDRIR